jgi:hypothetical protein
LEIKLLGRSFTLVNNQENPIMSHIDRIFCNIEFEGKISLATAKALPRAPSDHVPILWEWQDQKKRKPGFKFEKWWLLQEGFKELVHKIWSTPIRGGGGVSGREMAK